jgi:hypothetical protein
MTAEAISWHTKFPKETPVIPIEHFYTAKEQETFIEVVK